MAVKKRSTARRTILQKIGRQAKKPTRAIGKVLREARRGSAKMARKAVSKMKGLKKAK
jgi:hypothetical protein